MTEQSTTELAQPTFMEDVEERIALRIKASLVELMPEDAWTKMVEGGLLEFTLPHRPDYHGKKRPSHLQKIVHGILEEKFREMFKIELAKPKYNVRFGVNGQAEPGEFVTDFIKENMTVIIMAMLAGLGQSFIEQVKNSIQQDLANRY